MTDQHLPEGRRLEGSLEKLVGIVSGEIGWLVFNNPERRNACSRAMWDALPGLIEGLNADPAVKVIILTGAGGKAFVSGADISEFEEQRASPEASEAYRIASDGAFASIEQSGKPTIAMISGACVGGGLATALSCDIRIAREGSRFGIPAAKLGIGYPFGGVQKLVSLIGPARTKQVLFTAELCSAETACQIGLINEIVGADDLEPRVMQIAGMIAENAPLSIASSKLSVDQAVKDAEARDPSEIEARISRAMLSDDIKEGHRAFMEKRKPDFKGQ